MNETEEQIVKALQEEFPLNERPFAEVAERVGISEEELLARLAEWKRDGVLRRFGAILRHHKAGFDANAMTAWVVPEGRVEEVGPIMASFKEVSHCYERPTFPGFPYNLYTMIHGRSREECAATAKKISEATGISEYRALYTIREFKKTSPIYFRRRS